MKQLKKLSLTLALLLTAATGAWAQWTGGTYTATTNEELGAITVGADATLTINEGVTVTVSGGINANGHTLTVNGAGMLTVTGTNGANGTDGGMYDGGGGGNGSAGFTGTLIVDGATVNVTGGNGGNGGSGFQYGGNGGNGAAGVSGSITLNSGSVTVTGGAGGNGGSAMMKDGSRGSAGQAVTGTITASTAEESDDNSTWTAISGNTSSKRYVRAESTVPAFDVTINDDKTEASFEMPTYDVNFSYELVRDMSVSMTTKIGDGNDGYRIRLKKNEQTGKYEPAEMTVQQMMALVKVHDAIENQDLTFGVLDANCIVNIYAANENNEATGDPIAFPDLTPGRYIAKAVAAAGSAYEGETGMSNIFELYEGYQVVIPAGEYVTYYKDEAVRLEEKDKNDIELCTITAVEDGKAVLSDNFDAMKANTPFLLKNTTNEEKTILLIPCSEPELAVTVADEFIGTLTVKEFTAAETQAASYYVCNGKEFVQVRGAGSLGANKAYLKMNGSAAVNAPRLVIGFGGEGTTGISEEVRVKSEEFATAPYYDLNGRKLQGKPTQKGVYIQNGKKVVVK